MAVWAPIRPKTSPSSCSVSTRSPTSAVGLDRPRLVDGHLGEFVLDLADDAARAKDADLAGLGIDPHVDVLVTGHPTVGRLDAVLDGSDQLLARDLLFGIELEEGTDEVSTHDDLRSLCRLFLSTLKKKRGGHPRHGAAVQLLASIHPGAWTAQTGPETAAGPGGHCYARTTMPWHPTNLSAEPLPRPALVPVRVDGRALVLASVGGEWYALEDRCSHAGCAFSEDAAIEGDRLVCDCHGSEFDIRTGAVAGPPATLPVASFAVRVIDGHLEVEL